MLVFLIILILFCTINLNMTHFELIRGGNQLSKRFKLVEESFTGVSIYIDQRTYVTLTELCLLMNLKLIKITNTKKNKWGNMKPCFYGFI